MATKPVLDERNLKKALTDQGFDLKTTTKGVRVLAPDGVGTSMIHPSVFTTQQGRRAYRNQIAELVRIGFDLSRVDVDTNGRSAEWKEDRDAIDAIIAEQDAEAKAQREAEDVVALDRADLHAVVSSLTPGQRALYDKIVANPGRAARDYAESKAAKDREQASRFGQALIKAGLIVGMGQRVARVWYPRDAAPVGAEEPLPLSPVGKAGRPSHGPVRVRHVEPADRTVRMRRLGDRVDRLLDDLKESVAAMVSQYGEQEGELKQTQGKLGRLERILSQGVDAL